MDSAWKPFQKEWRTHLENLFANSSLAPTFWPSQCRAVNLQRFWAVCSCPCSRELPHQYRLCCLLQNTLSVSQACASPISQYWIQDECQSSVARLWGRTVSFSQTFTTKERHSPRPIYVICMLSFFQKMPFCYLYFFQKSHPHRPRFLSAPFYMSNFTQEIYIKKAKANAEHTWEI